ncbi:MAG: ABC transporter permease [Nocardioidaceae bacterium]
MTSITAPSPAVRRSPGRLRTFWTTLRAVVTRELRWRMRGRRAFVVATVFVLLLGLLVFGIQQLASATFGVSSQWILSDPMDGTQILAPEVTSGLTGTGASLVGASVYGALLVMLTILVMIVAPALASGVISSEREKQTLELLVTTPISSLGLVVGKLVASLAYVLLLLVASVPLMTIAYVFGGVGPEDVLRAYVVVLAVAFGLGALGLFLSALIGRTQLALVVAYIVILLLTVLTFAVHGWMYLSSVDDNGRFGVVSEERHAPEPLLWLNPAVADADVLCSALPESRVFCAYTSAVIGRDVNEPTPPRDALWPKVVAGLVAFGVALTLLTTQLISPSRGIRAGRRRRRVSAASAPPGVGAELG